MPAMLMLSSLCSLLPRPPSPYLSAVLLRQLLLASSAPHSAAPYALIANALCSCFHSSLFVASAAFPLLVEALPQLIWHALGLLPYHNTSVIL